MSYFTCHDVPDCAMLSARAARAGVLTTPGSNSSSSVQMSCTFHRMGAVLRGKTLPPFLLPDLFSTLRYDVLLMIVRAFSCLGLEEGLPQKAHTASEGLAKLSQQQF